MSEELRPVIVSQKVLWNSALQSIEQVQLRCADGSVQARVVSRNAPGAVIAAINDKQKILLIRSYRFTIDRWLLELPAGKIEDGDHLAAAQRELAEETGYRGLNWFDLGTAYGAQGTSDWLCHYYLASDLEGCEQAREPHENHEILWYSLQECWDLISSGEIANNYTITGFIKAAMFLNQPWNSEMGNETC